MSVEELFNLEPDAIEHEYFPHKVEEAIEKKECEVIVLIEK